MLELGSIIVVIVIYVFLFRVGCQFYEEHDPVQHGMSLRSCLAVALGLTLGFTLFTLTLIASARWSPQIQLATPTIAVSEPDLSGQVRVLCMVMTHSSKHKTRTVAVRDTWGRHCNTLIFMSNTYDPSIPTVDTKIQMSKIQGPWKMTVFSLQHVLQNYTDQFDWVFKCDDDTYAIMENMREYLTDFSPQNKTYMGFQLGSPGRYTSGGAGYILSKGTLQFFLDHCKDINYKDCSPDIHEMEDVAMGRCMQSLGVEFVDTRDSHGRERFFTEQVSSHVFPRNDVKVEPYVWYLRAGYFSTSLGMKSVPENPISFHHVPYMQMYSMEYMIYETKRRHPQIMNQPTIKPLASKSSR